MTNEQSDDSIDRVVEWAWQLLVHLHSRFGRRAFDLAEFTDNSNAETDIARALLIIGEEAGWLREIAPGVFTFSTWPCSLEERARVRRQLSRATWSVYEALDTRSWGSAARS